MSITFDQHTLILTANARLASYLQKQYDNEQAANGNEAWRTLNCLPFNQWMRKTVEDDISTDIMLSDAQELSLWEDIISHADNHQTIYHPFKIAEIARQSYRLLKQWNLSLTDIADSHIDDTRLFYQWANQFKTICNNNRWLIQDDCANLIIEAVTNNIIKLPKKIVIAGFDELTPQKQNLITELKQHCEISFHQTNCTNTQPPIRTALANEEAEILHMAQWAKDVLDTNPDTKIACIAPHLNQIREKVISIFTETFADDPIAILNDHTLPFNISASQTFYDNPLIYTALQTLSLTTKEIDLNKISALLRSPFISSSQKEMTSRASLNLLLHQTEERALSISTITKIAKKNSLCPEFIADLKNFNTLLPFPNEKQTLKIWKEKITGLLTVIGWPGERTMSSDEHQQYQRWQKLLIEFTQLDVIHSHSMTFSQALSQLKVLSQKTHFQSQTQDMPIQILGMLEASGMTFDHMWIMGMNDDKWPQPPAPNPFIPLALQRKYNMPHASADKEFSFSQTIMQRLKQSSENIIFSYSKQKDDTELRMSKLLEGIQEENITTAAASINYIPLETFTDHLAPPTPAFEKSRGGSSILKDQSACPFRAFAKHRLGAKSLPSPASGLSPQERGNLIHEILENTWEVLTDHQTLISFDEHELDNLIKTHITEALSNKSHIFSFTLKKQFMTLESQRLFKLIKQWLTIEKERPAFSVVAHETATKVDFAGLTLWLRIDREDELENGEKIIIDYKTGLTKIESWFGERPDDPQLPLYCLTSDHDIDGLLLAQIRPGALQFKGITADDYHIDGVKSIDNQKADTDITSWEQFKETQQQVLTQLSTDFQAGIATVDPKDPNLTCQYCDLHALCRVHG
jgi:ATP-dependent helicase/nuclease subunit B